jgi:purine-binding chemotaxis protein CheW
MENAMQPNATEPASNGTSFMVLTFELEGERFAVEVANVHEVIDPLPLTIVPNSDPFAPGLINARGSVVPVLDLQHRLGMVRREQTSDTRFVVLETEVDEDRTKFAMIADSVHEVIEIEETAIQPAPELGMKWQAEYIRGIAQKDDRLLIFLNTQTIFRSNAIN